MIIMPAHRPDFIRDALAGVVARCRSELAYMQRPPQIELLGGGKRLHLNDGPIDLVVDVDGSQQAIAVAYRAAAMRFAGLLDELCTELSVLRCPAVSSDTELTGKVARSMYRAVAPYGGVIFITPMAAVAGSVADEVLAAMREAASRSVGLTRVLVNNGGDIAIWLAPGQGYSVGLLDRTDRAEPFAKAAITAQDGIGGIATSGAHGRSFSLGIADAVTVFAGNAATADAAATVIANAVDLQSHPDIVRQPAFQIQPDSDLGDRPVTRRVPPLTDHEKSVALGNGLAVAERLMERGLILAAALRLQGATRLCGQSHHLLKEH